MDIDQNKGGWFSKITKTVTSTVKEIGSILTSDDDTPPTTQNKPSTGYMAQFDAVLNKELNPNASSPYPQNVSSPINAYPPYDPHHIHTQQQQQQQQQPYGYDQSHVYQQQHGYQQPQQQPPSLQQQPYGISQSSFSSNNNTNMTSTDSSQYPPYMYANLQSPQPTSQTSTYSSVPPPTFPSQTPSTSTFTPTPTPTPTPAPTTSSFTPFVPQPVISPTVSPSHTATSVTSAPSTSTPYLQPPFTPLPPISSPSHVTSLSTTYTGYTHGTAYPEQPAYLDTGYQQPNAYANDYYAQAQPGYQAPTSSSQQQQQQPLPPPPVSNYWKERAAVAPPPTATINEPHKAGSAPRVDYSDLDPRSMDFVYSDRKYN